MTSPQTIQLQVNQAAPRLDQYLVQELPQFSRSQLKKLIQQNQVLIDNSPAKPGSAIQPGDVVLVYLPAPEPPAPLPENAPLAIVYEDADILVVNKAAGMVVHPAQGHGQGTLVNALLAQYPALAAMTDADGNNTRPGIVHRLDQDTSGLMVVARTPAALQHLQRQFKARTVEKIYLALVFGEPEAPEGIIDVPLGRDPRHRQKFAAHIDGKPARTHYRVEERFTGYSLLKIRLETGRTHQIRVHLAWLKCPVVGDTVYGRKKNPLGLNRQFLHAWQLGFQHPRTGNPLHFEAPLEQELQTVLEQLRQP